MSFTFSSDQVRPRRRPGSLAVLVGLMTGAVLALAGCGSDTAGPEKAATVGEINNDPASSINVFSDPASFAGQQVTVSADVSRIIGPQAFTIAAQSGEALLVLHKDDVNLTPGSTVRLAGTVQKTFDVNAAPPGYTPFDPARYGAFGGEPYIVADTIDTPK